LGGEVEDSVLVVEEESLLVTIGGRCDKLNVELRFLIFLLRERWM